MPFRKGVMVNRTGNRLRQNKADLNPPRGIGGPSRDPKRGLSRLGARSPLQVSASAPNKANSDQPGGRSAVLGGANAQTNPIWLVGRAVEYPSIPLFYHSTIPIRCRLCKTNPVGPAGPGSRRAKDAKQSQTWANWGIWGTARQWRPRSPRAKYAKRTQFGESIGQDRHGRRLPAWFGVPIIWRRSLRRASHKGRKNRFSGGSNE